MSARFRELAWSDTEMGVISLQRRVEPFLEVEVYEVKLDEEYLMSSLFTAGEIELARLCLAEATANGLDVVPVHRRGVDQHGVRRRGSPATLCTDSALPGR